MSSDDRTFTDFTACAVCGGACRSREERARGLCDECVSLESRYRADGGES